MKKILMTLLCGMFLMLPQQSHAQFFKQLGKIAEGVGKDIGKAAEKVGTDMWEGITNGPFNVSAAKGTCTIENLTCVLQSAARRDDDLLFAATFKNETDDDINIEFNNIRVVDAEGNSYACTMAPGTNIELLSGVPVKATIIVSNVPQNLKAFSLVRFGAGDKGKAEWRNVTF